MNKAETGINGLAGGPVDQGADRRERLSALADGQLQGDELSAAFAYAAEDEDGAKTWQLYHLVGDVLRSADLAQPANPAFMARLREQLAQEALKQNMVLAPGALFGYDPARPDSMRFNVAHSDGPGVQQAFETLLLKAVREPRSLST